MSNLSKINRGHDGRIHIAFYDTFTRCFGINDLMKCQLFQQLSSSQKWWREKKKKKKGGFHHCINTPS